MRAVTRTEEQPVGGPVTAFRTSPGPRPESPAPRHAAPSAGRAAVVPVSWCLAAAGVLVIAHGYRIAARGGAPTAYYSVFWLGMLLALAPFTAVLLSRGASANARFAAVLSLGIVSYAPKLLRNPYGPLYHDELAQYRSVLDLQHLRGLFTPNPTITVAADYPGLHLATATIQGLTGMPFWAAATLLLLVAHTASLVAVLTLGRALLPDPRAAGLAALVYGLNSSYLYFDTQFAYESLAICFFLWALTLTVGALRSAGRVRAAHLAGAVALTAVCVMTHHLTTVILILLSALATATHALFRRRLGGAAGEWRPWAVVLLTAALGFAVWVLTVAESTYNYLRPYAGKALDQLAGQATGASSGREPFSGTVAPLYERVLGMAAPLVMGVVFVLAVLSTRLFRGWSGRRTMLTLAAFGSLYFLSVPFILAPEGAEGARRTWAFTYLGLALCTAGPAAALLWSRRRRRWTSSAVPVVLLALLVGNTSDGLNDAYRFPGPYRFGSDTNSLTTELIALAGDFGRRFPGQRVVTDRFTGLALVAYGDAFPAPGDRHLPTYDLFFSAADPDPFLVHELETGHYTYLVVDARLSRHVPLSDGYFDEPESLLPTPSGPSPVPQAALDRFDTVPWATKVLTTTDYSVYRLNFSAVGAPQCGRPGCVAGVP